MRTSAKVALALLAGLLSEPGAEVRIRRNRNGTYSARTYLRNREKIGHGHGADLTAAIFSSCDDNGEQQ